MEYLLSYKKLSIVLVSFFLGLYSMSCLSITEKEIEKMAGKMAKIMSPSSGQGNDIDSLKKMYYDELRKTLLKNTEGDNDNQLMLESEELVLDVDIKLVVQVNHSGDVKSIIFSPDGSYMVTSGEHKTIVWDSYSGTQIFNYMHPLSDFTAMAVSIDNKHLYAGNKVGELFVINMLTGVIEKKIDATDKGDNARAHVISAYSKRPVVFDTHSSSIENIYLKDDYIITSSPRKTIVRKTDDLDSVNVINHRAGFPMMSEVNNELIFFKKGVLSFYNLMSGEKTEHKIQGIEDISGSIVKMRVSASGKEIIAVKLSSVSKYFPEYNGWGYESTSRVLVVSIDDRKVVDVSDPIGGVVESFIDIPNGNKIIFSSYMFSSDDKKTYIWDRKYKTINNTNLVVSGPIVNNALDGSMMFATKKGGVQRWDYKGNRGVSLFDKDNIGRFKKIKFIQDGRRIVLGGGEGDILLVDTSSLEIVSSYSFNSEKIIDFSISLDEQNISAVTSASNAITWRIGSGELLNSVALPNTPLKINYIPNSNSYGILFFTSTLKYQPFSIIADSNDKLIQNFELYGEGWDNRPTYFDFSVDAKGGYAVFIGRSSISYMSIISPSKSKTFSFKNHEFRDVYIPQEGSDIYVVGTSQRDINPLSNNVNNYAGEVFVYDPWDKKSKRTFSYHLAPVNSTVVSDNGKTIYSGGDDNVVRVVYEGDDGLEKMGVYEGVSSPVIDITRSNINHLLAAVSDEGVVSIWDSNSRKKLSNIVYSTDEKKILSFTDSGYYKGDRDSMGLISFKYKNRGYRFSQFDHIFNRPDIVLKKLPNHNPDLVAALKMAYQKRLLLNEIKEIKKVNFDGIPIISILNKSELSQTKGEDKASLNIGFSYGKEELRSIHININGVEVKSVVLENPSKNGDVYETIFLSNGINVVDVYSMTVNGLMSLVDTITLKGSRKHDPVLHLISIGVSKYEDENKRLYYADKDARDISKYLEDYSGYSVVKKHTYLNEEVTLATLTEIDKLLQDVDIDDVVVLFYAGHGVLDSKFNYYLSTYDMNFSKPGRTGIPFERVENILNRSPSRNKVMFIDACFSGEFLKSDYEIEEVVLNEEIKFTRTSGMGLSDSMDVYDSFSLMKEIFSDTRNGTGAHVVASTGDGEYAYEDDKWENGVFTYSIIKSIISGEADRNFDGNVDIRELVEHVSTNVSMLTDGMQKPSYRSENILNNFVLSRSR